MTIKTGTFKGKLLFIIGKMKVKKNKKLIPGDVGKCRIPKHKIHKLRIYSPKT